MILLSSDFSLELFLIFTYNSVSAFYVSRYGVLVEYYRASPKMSYRPIAMKLAALYLEHISLRTTFIIPQCLRASQTFSPSAHHPYYHTTRTEKTPYVLVWVHGKLYSTDQVVCAFRPRVRPVSKFHLVTAIISR